MGGGAEVLAHGSCQSTITKISAFLRKGDRIDCDRHGGESGPQEGRDSEPK